MHSSPKPRAAATVAATLALFFAAQPMAQGTKPAKNAGATKQPPVGYDNTPIIPGTKWRVHDGKRPQPKVVAPGTASTQNAPGKPPADAIVLFDGKDLSKWTGRDGKAQWAIENGEMVVNRTGDIQTRGKFGDCQLHVEWCAPAPRGNSQGRGNSGVFLMGRYEVQVLDSYDNRTYPDGQAAALYGQTPPEVNACRAPGQWQTYDIIFEAPRFDGGKLVRPGHVTVIHNGVLVHHHTKLQGPTRHKQVTKYTPHGPEGPIKIQDHGNPVRYRNIWLRRLERDNTR